MIARFEGWLLRRRSPASWPTALEREVLALLLRPEIEMQLAQKWTSAEFLDAMPGELTPYLSHLHARLARNTDLSGLERLKPAVRKDAVQNALLRSELQKIGGVLHEADVQGCLLRGATMTPDATGRLGRGIDILVERDALARGVEALTRHGLKFRPTDRRSGPRRLFAFQGETLALTARATPFATLNDSSSLYEQSQCAAGNALAAPPRSALPALAAAHGGVGLSWPRTAWLVEAIHACEAIAENEIPAAARWLEVLGGGTALRGLARLAAREGYEVPPQLADIAAGARRPRAERDWLLRGRRPY